MREKALFDAQLISAARLARAEADVEGARTKSILSFEEHAHDLRSRTASMTGEAPPWLSFPVDATEVDIVAAASGTVIQRRVQLGQNLINLRDPLVVIGDQLVFRAYLDQRHVGQVRVGDRGRFHLRARPGAVFPTTVLRVDHEVATGRSRSRSQPRFTFAVWMAIPEDVLAGDGLLSGMNGFAIFERPYVAPAVPASALMRYSGQTGTLLVVDQANVLQIKAISYTGAEDGWVAVENADLAAGELVVVNGQIALRPGDHVSVAGQADATLRADRSLAPARAAGGVVPDASAAGLP